MSQHDLDIANQGFPATRADINNALQALGSSNSGATAPSTTYANQLWYDTANNIIKIRNEDNDAWISLFTLDQTNDNIEALTVNGTITADALTVDTNTLFVDSTNNEVGIGTLTPGGSLEVYKAGTSEVLIGTDNGGTAQLSLYESDDGTKEGLLKYDGTNNRMHLATSGNANAVVIPRDSGNVGVNTSTPASLLEIKASALNRANGIALRGSGANDILYIYPSADNVATIEHLIDGSTSSGGNIAINPQGGVVMVGTSSGIGNFGFLTFDPAGRLNIGRTNNDAVAEFYRSGTRVGSITVTTTNTAYNTSSDYRLKEAVVDMTGAIDRVKQLAPKRFNFIIEPDIIVDGFLAHEAQTVVPEAVTGVHNGTRAVTNAVLSSDGKLLAEDILQADWAAGKLPTTDYEGNAVDAIYPSDSTWSASHTEQVYQGIDQSKLVPLLTAALKESIAKIETLETQVADLTTRVTALEA